MTLGEFTSKGIQEKINQVLTNFYRRPELWRV